MFYSLQMQAFHLAQTLLGSFRYSEPLRRLELSFYSNFYQYLFLSVLETTGQVLMANAHEDEI